MVAIKFWEFLERLQKRFRLRGVRFNLLQHYENPQSVGRDYFCFVPRQLLFL
jgi:hypothetical protein